ncbi:hypothetical protein RAK27_02615 [Carnobacterium maltaromaticum]|uniref:Conjugal transfer protein n=1 Tax=Carnobacterium maltaromaticum TaxID=2751 RepID=A0AAW9K1A0_CARML|nr:hypothetical protein [Carnobacterium maltaromaticum]MDZ5757542.1 hypothetical protein [Carnobacterium maltaromaticum]
MFYDEYKLLLEPTGNLDVIGKIWSVMQTFLIEIPFAFLRIITSCITFVLDLLDVSAKIQDERSLFFEQSKDIYLKFIGGSNGRISTGSLGFILLMMALMYLTWQFFFGKGGFAKKALHVIVVVSLGFAYFGNFTVQGTQMSGGMYLFNTVDNVSEQLKSQMITTFSLGQSDESLTSQDGYGEYYKNYIILNSFNYINSGNTNGEYATGKKIDHSKLIPAENLSAKDKKSFYKEREGYLKEIAEDNPYVQNTADKMVDKMFMIALSYANAATLGFPVVYANVTLSAFQFIFLVLVLLFPLALLLSFIPFFRNAAFRILKMMIGILFMPVLIGFMLGIFFYLNGVVDNFVLSKATDVLGVPVAMAALGGTSLIVVMLVLIVIKAVLFTLIWKNKGKLLKLVSDNRLDDTIVNAPMNKIQEVGEKAVDTGTNVVQSVAGAYTGNPQLMLSGVNGLMDDGGGTAPSLENDPFMNEKKSLDDEDDKDELLNEDKFVQPTSLDKMMDDDSEQLDENEEIQDVRVMNSDDLVSDEELDEKIEDVNVQLNDLDGDDLVENPDANGKNEFSKPSDAIQGEDFVEQNEDVKNETLERSEELVGSSLFYDSVPDDSLFTVPEIPDPEQFQQNDNEGTMELNDSDAFYQEAFNSAQ